MNALFHPHEDQGVILGRDFLRHFRVEFDLATGHMALHPHADVARAPAPVVRGLEIPS